MFHRTQSKKESTFLISGSLRERKTTYPRLCLALRSLILDEVSKDVHEDFLKLPEVVSAIKEKLSFSPVNRKMAYGRVAGADAGSQRVPLASRWFAVIAAYSISSPALRDTSLILKP